MSTRPSDWGPLRPADPTDPVPGDPTVLREGATHYGKVAAAIENAGNRLRKLASRLDGSSSDAVDALRECAHEVAQDIGKAHQRYAGLGKALGDYAPALETAQEESRTLLRTADDAEVEAADHRRLAEAAATRAAAAPPGERDFELTEQKRQEGLAEDAETRLTTARRSLDDVLYERDRAKRTAVNLLKDVHGSGGLDDGWRDNFGGLVNRFVAPMLPVLNKLAAGLGVAALLFAWVPFIGAAALLVAGVAFLANLAMSVGKEAGWRDTIISGIGLATFGLGKIAAARHVASAGAARGAARRLAGQWAAKSPAQRAAQGLPTNSNPTAAINAMMGRAGTVTRNQARALLDAAKTNGGWTATKRFFRELPGKTGDDLASARSFDVRSNIPRDQFAFMGEKAMGPASKGLDDIHDVIRKSPDVSKHLKVMELSETQVKIGYRGGAAALVTELVLMEGPNPSAAERLNLSDRGALEPASV